MKQTLTFLKALSFLLSFLIVNSIYSQGACGAGYSFSCTGNNTTCNYVLLATYPHSPTVTNVGWRIYSSGASSKLCATLSGNNITYQFCFDGNYDIICTITFTGGSYCTITNTVNISCSGAIICDPSPSRIAAIPDPVVEITYIEPYKCGGSTSPYSNCMYDIDNSCGSTYCISCGWTWVIRIPPSGYNCQPFTYYVEYTDATTCGSYPCASIQNLDTTPVCIHAKIGTLISVVATANHCCLPDGYQRGYIWTPTMSGGGSYTPIRDPATPLGQCSGSRSCPTPNSGNCQEIQYTMSASSGWPSPPNCFTGGKKIEQRNLGNLNDNVNIEQFVFIYNIQGAEVFSGIWKFGDPSNLYLNWPNGIGSGLYFVKFQNSQKITKLYKF